MKESSCDSQAGGVSALTDSAWYAAYTRSRHEYRVRDYCLERGLEAFLPSYRRWRRWSDRRVQIEMPLFPSYVFVRLDEVQRQRAVQAPGFLWFVHGQSGPVRVADDELEAIRRLLASGLDFDPMPSAEVGDQVEIVSGAMRGCRGRLLRKDHGAIIMAVAAIQGGIRVCLPDSSWVRVSRGSRSDRPAVTMSRESRRRSPTEAPSPPAATFHPSHHSNISVSIAGHSPS
ncbi:MAG TPA: UpxY family transcription antiterminator [Terriglobales bacterium]